MAAIYCRQASLCKREISLVRMLYGGC